MTPETLREAYALYQRQKLRCSAVSTLNHYVITLKRFDRFLGRPALITDLTDDIVADIMASIINSGCSPRTANRFRDNVLAVWRFLARKHIVEVWPEVAAFTEPKRTPVAWSREQLATLWNALAAQSGFIGPVRSSLWWLALHAVCWDSGERVSAVLSLSRNDLDLDGRWVNVRAELRKGKREDKLSRLHPHTVLLLRRSLSDDRDAVFPWPFTRVYLWNRYHRLLKLAGLPHDRWHKFHCVRRSVASFFEASGGDATKLLGHADARVTTKCIDPRICVQQQAADVLFRPTDAVPSETPSGPYVGLDLNELLPAYHEQLAASASHEHAQRRTYHARKILTDAGVAAFEKLSADKLLEWFSAQANDGMPPATMRHYRDDVRGFLRWVAEVTGNTAAWKCAIALHPRSGKAGVERPVRHDGAPAAS